MADSDSDLAAKVAVNIITEIFKTCFSGLKEAEERVKTKNKQYDPFGLAAKRYANRVEERYNSVRIFGMDRPVPLRSIYTRVNVLRKITSRYRATVEELEHLFDCDLKSFGYIHNTRDGMEVVDEVKNLIVLGNPAVARQLFLSTLCFNLLMAV